MVRKKSLVKSLGFGVRWRIIAVAALATISVLSLVGFMLAHWTQRQILTTDNWVKLVAPLPKSEEVASALSQYSVDKLFSKIDLEQKVEDVLPPKAGFLAAPLAERLKTRTVDLTKNLIQSDQFQGVWLAANRQAHQRLVGAARGQTDVQQSEKRTGFGLKLESWLQSIRDRLGSSSIELFSNIRPSSSSLSLNVDLKSRFSNFKKFVNSIDFLNGMLWLVSLACLIGALALSRGRRRLFLVIMAAIAVVSLLQLIGVKALRPAVLNQIQDEAFRPAVGVVYDELLITFQRTATSVLAVSTFLFATFFIAGRPIVSKNRRLRKWLREFRTTKVWQTVHNIRLIIGKYRWPVVGISGFLFLLFMAFIPQFDWQGVFRGALAILSIIGLVVLIGIAPPQRLKRITK